jgi:ribose 5-phosphate isomerase B
MTVVALGADHAGFPLKQTLKDWLVAQGHTVLDMGTHSADSVDYPDFAGAVAHAVSAGEAARGLLVCGTGIGMAIAANKVPGIRAGVCADVETAQLSRQHNDLNVLALAGRSTPADRALAIVRAWLETAFEGGRHERRLAKVVDLERATAPAVGEVTGAAAR